MTESLQLLKVENLVIYDKPVRLILGFYRNQCKANYSTLSAVVIQQLTLIEGETPKGSVCKWFLFYRCANEREMIFVSTPTFAGSFDVAFELLL